MMDREPNQVGIAHLLVPDDLTCKRLNCFQVANIRGPIFMVRMGQTLL